MIHSSTLALELQGPGEGDTQCRTLAMGQDAQADEPTIKVQWEPEQM